MAKERKIFFVVASGGHGTDKHYVDTIVKKRELAEAKKFLEEKDSQRLEAFMHGQPFAVWGAVLGERNVPLWETMESGDYVLIYKSGKIILVAEVATKVRNPALAQNYWGSDADGKGTIYKATLNRGF